MGRKFTYLNSWFTVIALAIAVNFALAKGVNAQKSDSSYLRSVKAKSKTSYLKNGLHLALPPLKPNAVSAEKINLARPDDKLISNVVVYPIPVTNMLNIKYRLSRNSYVNIVVMDILGNTVLTLVSQRVEFGEQIINYNINNKLPRSFYFLRITAGIESVNTRISVIN
ncbi:T9SS type A sorting domain-containing protein [Mucilaginibacter sp. RB4R14]|uniref:T9SS type A sorting domain-containing protein n=1 Tax=Mucilaginibacter aurantiaciroseus TaxID=2949308 RepID=UPI00209114DC|nr:T9SS type A sorting domain-containing protein [Mucilaginibacter aurantiaciroseus]MCO5934061.1 T9SS type A sorting domain-containing protein [Mucilaginibacter aurantiaciroseus]